MPDIFKLRDDQGAMNRYAPWLGAFVMTSVLFVLGVGVGALAGSHRLRGRMEQRLQHPEVAVQEALGRMQDELDLSPEQAKELQTVLENHGERLKTLREEMRPKMDAEFDALRESVAALLDEEQKEIWQGRFKNLRGRWMRPPHGGGPGRGPGPGHGPAPWVEEADVNQDGQLSFDEIQAQRPRFPKERFSEMDADGDGMVSLEEFRQKAPRMGPEPGPGPWGPPPPHGNRPPPRF
jgi:hypothetical protein